MALAYRSGCRCDTCRSTANRQPIRKGASFTQGELDRITQEAIEGLRGDVGLVVELAELAELASCNRQLNPGEATDGALAIHPRVGSRRSGSRRDRRTNRSDGTSTCWPCAREPSAARSHQPRSFDIAAPPQTRWHLGRD